MFVNLKDNFASQESLSLSYNVCSMRLLKNYVFKTVYTPSHHINDIFTILFDLSSASTLNMPMLVTCLPLNPFSLVLKERNCAELTAMLALVTYIVWDQRCSSLMSSLYHKKRFTLLFDDKIQLSWHEKLSFKLSTIICVIHGLSHVSCFFVEPASLFVSEFPLIFYTAL